MSKFESAVHATTLGELRASGYPDRTVKEELRDNLVQRLEAGRPLFPSIIGFDESVVPSLERGILAGHDLVLLGERGQAKTRLIRHMVDLLDEWTPVVAGCEVNDHPYHPICARCRGLLGSEGDALPIDWIARDR
ncbi:MAG TPA: magnesium chelatase, partial [Actinomycetota bacterium]|nr:magnesium chelatase [Actinomycetota bacterium]